MNPSSMACRIGVVKRSGCRPCVRTRLERLGLRCGGECEETEVRLPAAFGHAWNSSSFRVGLPRRLSLLGFVSSSPVSPEHLLQFGRGLARLRAVGLVHDDGVAPRREFAVPVRLALPPS